MRVRKAIHEVGVRELVYRTEMQMRHDNCGAASQDPSIALQVEDSVLSNCEEWKNEPRHEEER